jgi:hypothetical protein
MLLPPSKTIFENDDDVMQLTLTNYWSPLFDRSACSHRVPASQRLATNQVVTLLVRSPIRRKTSHEKNQDILVWDCFSFPIMESSFSPTTLSAMMHSYPRTRRAHCTATHAIHVWGEGREVIWTLPTSRSNFNYSTGKYLFQFTLLTRSQ